MNRQFHDVDEMYFATMTSLAQNENLLSGYAVRIKKPTGGTSYKPIGEDESAYRILHIWLSRQLKVKPGPQPFYTTVTDLPLTQLHWSTKRDELCTIAVFASLYLEMLPRYTEVVGWLSQAIATEMGLTAPSIAVVASRLQAEVLVPNLSPPVGKATCPVLDEDAFKKTLLNR